MNLIMRTRISTKRRLFGNNDNIIIFLDIIFGL